MNATKKAKATKTKKDWRKNIDVTQEENVRVKKLHEEMVNKQLQHKKDDDLFKIDVEEKPIPAGFLKKKTEGEDTRAINKVVDKKVKQQLKYIELMKDKNIELKKEAETDLKLVEEMWGNDNARTSKGQIKLSHKEEIKYPKVILPHPGHSYNPDKEATKALISKVAELNKTDLQAKKFLAEPVQTLSQDEPDIDYNSDEDSDEENSQEDAENKIKKSTRPLTKTQRNKKIKTNLNKVKNRAEYMKKQTKKEISNIVGDQKFSKIQKRNMELKKSEEEKKKALEKKKHHLLKLGVVDE